MKTFIGIDPGKSGGIAEILGDQATDCCKMPETERDIFNTLECAMMSSGGCFAVIERVHAMPGNGAKSMFSFGQNYGFLRGCLISLGIPFEEVTPQKWMKFYQLKRAKTETNTQWKNRLKQKAQQLFPDLKVTLATADALLIANYCKYYKTANKAI